jgi:hypothetical protein
VLWAASALGCYLDPKLLEVAEDEVVTLYIQKRAPHLSPALVKNKTTTLVVMPINPDGAWLRQIEAIKIDQMQLLEKEERQAA